MTTTTPITSYDFALIKGQEHVKRALEVAMTGGHHTILTGPPGCGKTLLATAATHLLAPLFGEPYSIHTVEGRRIPPGTMAKANGGVIRLDDLTRFSTSTLEQLGRIMDEGVEAGRRGAPLPANTMIIASVWPCACGWHGNPEHTCSCSPVLVDRLRKHIAALTRRAHIHVEVPTVSYEKMASQRLGEPSEHVGARIKRAWAFQVSQGRSAAFRANSTMSMEEVRTHCQLDGAGTALMKAAVRQLNLSAGAYQRTLMVARTIADLAGQASIGPAHLAEAIQYRSRTE